MPSDVEVLPGTPLAMGQITRTPEFDHLKGWVHLLFQLSLSKHCLDRLNQIMGTEPVADTQDLPLGTSLDGAAHLSSFATAYGRCFRSGAYVQLDHSKVFKQHRAYIGVHNRILLIRDKFAAHTDSSELIEVHVGRAAENQRRIRYGFMFYMPVEERIQFAEVVDIVEQWVCRRLRGLERKADADKGQSEATQFRRL